jgi:hypothetical protein
MARSLSVHALKFSLSKGCREIALYTSSSSGDFDT